ncbi:MAG: hypothetical protein Q4F05_11435 [bacterium]|nr:hypothetical protein [bacterium]
MKEQILKAIRERINFPQHHEKMIKVIIETEVGTADVTTSNVVLSRIAIEIICKLKAIGCISELIIGYLYEDLLEAMGVY